jgi:hypothetical protein
MATEKRERMVSYEHRCQMCQLAFAHLNQEDAMSSKNQKKQTKVVVSDAEYMSWANAVKDMYVHGENCCLVYAPKERKFVGSKAVRYAVLIILHIDLTKGSETKYRSEQRYCWTT